MTVTINGTIMQLLSIGQIEWYILGILKNDGKFELFYLVRLSFELKTFYVCVVRTHFKTLP